MSPVASTVAAASTPASSNTGPITGGYGTEAYAAALHHIGRPVHLHRSATWVLRRPVPGGGHDLAGPYPLLRCQDWDALVPDLAARSEDLTFCAVTDALVSPPSDMLGKWFPDCHRPWKPHYVVDLPYAVDTAASSHHRRNLRRASVDVVAAPAGTAVAHLVRLYSMLAARHAITGDADFPSSSLEAQLAVPGARTWLAVVDDEVVAIVVAYCDGHLSWYHLGAAAEEGYRRGAMYALFAAMFTDLAAEGVRVVDLGAGAGSDGSSAGLERFKRGWATRTLPTHLVGAVLDPDGCRVAVERRGDPRPRWFPPYRGAAR